MRNITQEIKPIEKSPIGTAKNSLINNESFLKKYVLIGSAKTPITIKVLSQMNI
jgi:hypothetical protein